MTGRLDVHELAAARRQRPTRPRSGPIRTVEVNAAAWEVAMLLSGRDPRRIGILSETEIIITNG